MFSIKSYLQYKNTPNGKPRVLIEGVDYKVKDMNFLYESEHDYKRGLGIAYLSDCRPLLTVEIDGEEWTEGDIGSYKDTEFPNFVFSVSEFFKEISKPYPDLSDHNLSDNKNLGSFFDDPAKYSKLLWDCSEEEGWDKIFKLLEISK